MRSGSLSMTESKRQVITYQRDVHTRRMQAGSMDSHLIFGSNQNQ
jgi:hypothetical protein